MRFAVNGPIVGDSDAWLYEFFDEACASPGKLRAALEEAKGDGELVLEVNSGGGSVYAGFEMYSVLKGAGVKTIAEVQSLAASAASTVMLGCDEVRASPVAQVMIHLPSMVAAGDRRDLLAGVEMLDKTTESILNGYTAKCGDKCSREELKSMMKKTSWLTAADAQRIGLVDTIIGAEEMDPSAVLNAADAAEPANAAPARMTEADMRALYQRMVDEGRAPEQHGFVRAGTAENAAENEDIRGEAAADIADAMRTRLALEAVRFADHF